MPQPPPTIQADDSFASRLRGFGPIGLLAILLILAGNLLFTPLSALLVLGWAWRSRTPWRDIGYVRPRTWIGDLLLGLILGAALKILMKAVAMPLLFKADPINHAYQHLVGNTAALPAMVALIVIGAGFGEETLFRGYMFERLGRLFGSGLGAKAGAVLLTSALFGLAHYPEQGLAGVEQATIVGLVFGTIYCTRSGRLWLLMCAHAAFDLVALAVIYLDLEVAVARLLLGD